MRFRIRKLSTQIFLAQLVILTASMAVGFVLFAQNARAQLDIEYQSRAAAIGQTVAGIPLVRGCMAEAGPSCPDTLQGIAEATRTQTGAAYVVLIDMNRVRHTHPNTALIGVRIEEPIVVKDGKVHLGIDSGFTGVTANARVPLYGPGGALAGEVSVGIRESSVSSELLGQLPSYALWFVVALVLGALASWALAAWMKRRTFGLELDEIVRLLQEREATLHGIREGVIAIDPGGRVSVVNDEAQRLLGLPPVPARRLLTELIPPGRLLEVLTDPTSGEDEIVITDDLVLVVNRMPVTLAGHAHGSVVTLRDRTEVEGLTSELAGERSLTESMRAQQHEFSNRMHAIAGLLELGRPADALQYVSEIRGTTADLDETLRSHFAAPQIIGLMLGKAAEANERGIDLVITSQTNLGRAPGRVQALTTILGNLIDNAFDAVGGTPPPRRVEVTVVDDAADLTVIVSDSGPGVPANAAPHIFRDGYTTKHGSLVRHGGLGLALVHSTVTKLGGSISVSGPPGATFTVTLPRAAESDPNQER
jgi:two-component system CitB family sensor kinase